MTGLPSSIACVVAGMGPGGAERVLSLLANRWAARGAKVAVLTFEPPGRHPFHPLDPAVRYLPLGEPPGRLTAARAALRSARRTLALRRALRDLSPDVAVAFLTKINVLTLLAASGTGLPVVVSERNNPERDGLNAGWSWLRERLYPGAARVVCQTEAAKGFVDRTTGGRAKTLVIPNPIAAPGPVAANPDRERTLVAVGRLVPQKGFDLLLEAFALIAEKHAGWRLVVRGEGPLRAELERRRDALGLRGRVAFEGVTAQPGAWTGEGAVFVLSSRFEGFSNALAEAMAAGMAVAAYDCPWSPGEMIDHGDDGLLARPEDPRSMAEALEALMGDPGLRARLSQAARLKAARWSLGNVLPLWDEALLAARAAHARTQRSAPAPAFGR